MQRCTAASVPVAAPVSTVVGADDGGCVRVDDGGCVKVDDIPRPEGTANTDPSSPLLDAAEAGGEGTDDYAALPAELDQRFVPTSGDLEWIAVLRQHADL